MLLTEIDESSVAKTGAAKASSMSEEVSIQEQEQAPVHESVVNDTAPGNMEEDTSMMRNDDNGEIKDKIEEMEKEAAKLRELHSQLNQEEAEAKNQEYIDSRSIYVGNVDYGATPLELQQHFSSAGVVNRVTILINKFTGQPKGFAYLELGDIDAVNKAIATLDGSVFRDRELKVSAKRTNVPGLSSTNRGAFRGRGGLRGGRGAPGGAFRGGFRGGFRGAVRGRGRGRGSSRFTPY